MAYDKPRYTQVPNQLFDIQLADMSEAELKVTLALIRCIIGWHKTKPEPVSYSQLEEKTGLGHSTVVTGIKLAIDRGNVVLAGKGKRGVNLYEINFYDGMIPIENQPSQNLTSSNSEQVTSINSEQVLVRNSNTQKKDSKEIKDSKKKDSASQKNSDAGTPDSKPDFVPQQKPIPYTGHVAMDNHNSMLETKTVPRAVPAHDDERIEFPIESEPAPITLNSRQSVNPNKNSAAAPEWTRVDVDATCSECNNEADWECDGRAYCEFHHAELTKGVEFVPVEYDHPDLIKTIEEVFEVYGGGANSILTQLRGTAKRGDWKKNRFPQGEEVDGTELRRWAGWFETGRDYSMVKVPHKIYSEITHWRKLGSPNADNPTAQATEQIYDLEKDEAYES